LVTQTTSNLQSDGFINILFKCSTEVEKLNALFKAAQPGVEKGLESSRLARKLRLGLFYFPLNFVFSIDAQQGGDLSLRNSKKPVKHA
jgi:hypothetical protein